VSQQFLDMDIASGSLHPVLTIATYSSSFTPLDTYLQTQEALSYAASRPITQSGGDQDAMMDMLEGKDGKKPGAAGLKRKGSEKGSRAAEVSCRVAIARNSGNETDWSNY